ncbi:MAG: nucleotidyltransferase, partial [Planctomycetes bacterium]|nr:nucleotidyltransferase [Planctomycetota bacterium]
VEKGKELKSEFYLPEAVDVMIRKGQVSVKVLPTSDKWFGVTYREDKQIAQAKIADLVQQGLYPERLWETL